MQYFRLHGAPHIYYDAYSDAALHSIERRLQRVRHGCAQRWCVLDNTALGHAVANALDLIERIGCRTSLHVVVPRRTVAIPRMPGKY